MVSKVHGQIAMGRCIDSICILPVEAREYPIPIPTNNSYKNSVLKLYVVLIMCEASLHDGYLSLFGDVCCSERL